jgi:hypothetical protein
MRKLRHARVPVIGTMHSRAITTLDRPETIGQCVTICLLAMSIDGTGRCHARAIGHTVQALVSIPCPLSCLCCRNPIQLGQQHCGEQAHCLTIRGMEEIVRIGEPPTNGRQPGTSCTQM